MWTAIISGVVALGSAVIGYFTSGEVNDTQQYIADTRLRMTEIQADANIYMSDMAAVSQQYENQYSIELQEYKNAGFQTGILTLAISIVCIIYIMKKGK
jgi:hypothetical protein